MVIFYHDLSFFDMYALCFARVMIFLPSVRASCYTLPLSVDTIRSDMNKAFFCAMAVVALPATANTVPVAIPQPAAEPIPRNVPAPDAADLQRASPERVQVSLEELRQNPEWFAQALDQAIVAGDGEAIRTLLPAYRALPAQQQYEQLVRFAQAALATADGNHKEAVALYREMIAADPSLQPVRLHMALALMQDHQDDAAYDQLERLRSEELPDDIVKLVDQALDTLRKRRSWSFNATAYYRYEPNINSAPEEREIAWGNGTLTFPEKQSANGVYLGLDAEKRFPLAGNFYATLTPSVDVDFFWDAKEFNDYRLRFGAGAGYQDTRWDVRLEPYAGRRIYGDKGYSTTLGGVVSAHYWATPKIRLSATTDINRTTHDEREHLDGNRYFAGLNALYVHKPTTYFFGGVSAYDSNAEDPSDAFLRYGLSLGWGQEWSYGISSRATASYGRRKYDGADFFGILRKDHEYGVNLALWNRNWHFYGLTPKLNVQWNKTNSNHFYYGKDSVNAYIEISRTF